MAHQHKASLTQSNKPFKGKGHNSKNLPKEKRQGIKTLTKELCKADRSNNLRQLRDNKRMDNMQARLQSRNMNQIPPKTVLLVSFHSSADTFLAKKALLKNLCEASEVEELTPNSPSTILLPAWAQSSDNRELKKQRMTLIDCPRDNNIVMDMAKIADIILCVFGKASLEDPAFDTEGYELLQALRLQGLPSVIGMVSHSLHLSLNPKQISENKKFATRYFQSEVGEDKKIFITETPSDQKNLIRALSSITPKVVNYRNDRGYLLGQSWSFDEERQVLIASGYVRGVGFTCRLPVHVTGLGDGILGRIIDQKDDPCPLKISHSRDGKEENEESEVLDQIHQDDVEFLSQVWEDLRPYNPLEGDQNFDACSMADEDMPMDDEEENINTRRTSKRTPFRIEAEGQEEPEEMEEEGEGEEEKEESNISLEDGSDGELENFEMNGEEHVGKKREELIKRSIDEMHFPDEVDTPLDVPARERFIKYRGLKSFHTSSWDPYEELPVEYSRIFEYESYKGSLKAARQEFASFCDALPQGNVSGRFVQLEILGMNPESVRALQETRQPVIVSSLLSIERKVGVQHIRVQRTNDNEDIMKNKDMLEMHVGFRKCVIQPTYSNLPLKTSQDKKTKLQKFFHQGDNTEIMMSFYAPTLVMSSAVTLYKKDISGMKRLCAWGTVMNPDSSRVVLKRILLTGYPFRVHKNKVVVRFMFFNPQDIKWFKPVQLQSKKGLFGYIRESLGTHGYMKCCFNAAMSYADTVMMPLYKRVYPKFNSMTWGGATNDPKELVVSQLPSTVNNYVIDANRIQWD